MAEVGRFDITPVQYSALLAVRNQPGIDQTTLMQIVAFDRSTIGEVVERLQTKKLVRRAVSAKDRRARVLFVTPAGEQLLEQIEPFELAVQRLILEPLTRSERTEFMRLVRKLVELNNEHSRVPLRVQAPAPAKRKSASARRKTAAPAR
jgi:DNA-binding MarR family transcriptional regulator